MERSTHGRRAGFGVPQRIARLAMLGAAVLPILVAGCAATDLLTREDYRPARASLAGNDLEGARVNLPRGEEDGFITTLEKAYLALLQGRPEIDALRAQADALEGRVRYHVSREAKTFFYLQTPEDYYASEHEVIWLHLLLSWGYALRGEAEKACVEARIAGSLLDLPASPAGRFDDPALRVMLAALWAACGSWREAQVDLRAAARLDPALGWAGALAARGEPPAHLVLVLGGTGPEPYWSPEASAYPLRAARQVGFRLAGRKSALEIVDVRGVRIAAQRTPDAAAWYARHVQRDNEIHELIKDSHYAKDIVVHGGVASARIGASTAAGIAWGVGGVAVGGVLLRAAAQSGNGQAVLLGLTVAAAGIAKGLETAKSGYRESTRELERRLDPSPGYRFVRFLPEYFWLAWSDAALEYPVQARTADWLRPNIAPLAGTRPAVSIAFLPDAETHRTGRQ